MSKMIDQSDEAVTVEDTIEALSLGFNGHTPAEFVMEAKRLGCARSDGKGGHELNARVVDLLAVYMNHGGNPRAFDYLGDYKGILVVQFNARAATLADAELMQELWTEMDANTFGVGTVASFENTNDLRAAWLAAARSLIAA
jgi:hypothetical protein